ncbi:MAG: lipoyl domain-containing protein [Bradyrhizobiaceae bacterium]|nr:lipoyl domain-containing protein [Bradyrhizobiaceae bacterium]
MRSSLKLARIGMNMEEATIVKWHKRPGERFAPGEPLYEFETEKVTQEVDATAPGQLLEISVPEGEVAQVGQVVCVVDVELPAKT